MTSCRKCGEEMQRAAEGSGGTPLGAIALALIGVALLFVFPAGTAIGVLLIVAETLSGLSVVFSMGVLFIVRVLPYSNWVRERNAKRGCNTF